MLGLVVLGLAFWPDGVLAQGLAAAQGQVEEGFLSRILRGVIGVTFLLGVVWAFSARRRAIAWGLVAKGLGLQIVFALLVLKTRVGQAFFGGVNDVFAALIAYTDEGSRFLFGSLVDGVLPVDGAAGSISIGAHVAFRVLPSIIFFASLMGLAYHMGIMQRVVSGVAWIMRRSLNTSGAETTSAAGNIFFGQTEAPLLIKPFVKNLTQSELHTVMSGGFATVAGGVLAAYAAMLLGVFPDIAGHLLAASIMAAPASIVVSKMLLPETETPETSGVGQIELPKAHANLIDAAAGGASDGLKLALNVGAMVLAFLALIALVNGILGWGTGLFGVEGITLERLAGFVFAPIAWLIGVPWADAMEVGQLFGVKMIANEFVAFTSFAGVLDGGAQLSQKSIIICTYALTGFANLSSIGIQIGGIGSIEPARRKDLSRLGLRAMLSGTAATWMTATLAGVLA